MAKKNRYSRRSKSRPKSTAKIRNSSRDQSREKEDCRNSHIKDRPKEVENPSIRSTRSSIEATEPHPTIISIVPTLQISGRGSRRTTIMLLTPIPSHRVTTLTKPTPFSLQARQIASEASFEDVTKGYEYTTKWILEGLEYELGEEQPSLPT